MTTRRIEDVDEHGVLISTDHRILAYHPIENDSTEEGVEPFSQLQ